MKLTIDPEGIGRLVFDVPDEKVNTLTRAVMEEFTGLIEGLADNTYIKALLIMSGKPKTFIAGANLREIEYLINDPESIKKMLSMGHRIFNKLQELPFPTIAVIDGICLGGGLELALACNYRVVIDNPKTRLGLPEVNLGIFPGWGGTQRLPRLVGLERGLKMILTGKPVSAIKAWKIGLADAVVAPEFFEERVNEFTQSVIKSKIKRPQKKGLRRLLLEKNPIGRYLLYHQTRKQILKKTKGFYPAPLAALDVIKKSYTKSLKKGLKIELEAFTNSRVEVFANAKNLIKLYFANEQIKKDTDVPKGTIPKEIKSIGIIGAGTMGGGIAWVVSNRGFPVRIKDINWVAVGKGYGAAWDIYSFFIKRRKLTKREALLKFQRISGTIDYTGFQHVDLVIEAAVEDLKLKKKIFSELEEKVSQNTIIATNTSSLLISDMIEEVEYPERFIGMHFFNPANRMPLVEIIPTKKTSPETIATAVEFCKKIKKIPIVVGECRGFVVNRILGPALIEMFTMLEEGVEMERLEKAFLNFGFPMGPFILADEIGNDVNIKVFTSFEKAYGERMKVPVVLETMYEQGLYGKKAGKGFYLYNKKKKRPNPEVKKIIESIQTKKVDLSDQEIIDRVILVMINEATRCLEEKIVRNPTEIDMALVLGSGFPPFRGGLLRYADTFGIKKLVAHMEQLEIKFGSRFKPCDLLLEMESKNRGFY